MQYILNIDTSLPKAIVSISENGLIRQIETNENQRNHAAFLHPAINLLLEREKIEIKNLSAIAVAVGPGSYTGIRVAMATAKGLCLALNIPIIAIDNLRILAAAGREDVLDETLICSMIDARRMEVFTATYDLKLNLKSGPEALVLNINAFSEEISQKKILFCGNGSKKFGELIPRGENFKFVEPETARAMAELSNNLYKAGSFSNLIDTEPFYMKDFYNG